MDTGIIIYHDYVSNSDPKDRSVNFTHSCVTYKTRSGVSDCEWIVPGTLEAAERIRRKLQEYRQARGG